MSWGRNRGRRSARSHRWARAGRLARHADRRREMRGRRRCQYRQMRLFLAGTANSAIDVRFSLGLDGAGRVDVRPVRRAYGHGGAGELGSDQGPPSAVLWDAAAARVRLPRRVRRARHHAVLRLLRVHADSALLPDRRLGKRRSSVCGGEVLPLHARRQYADVSRFAGDRAVERRSYCANSASRFRFPS